MMDFPSLDCGQRQTFALVMLGVGEVVLTLLWVGLYAFEAVAHVRWGFHAEIAAEGQAIIWRLMALHAGVMGAIALGDIVSARIGDWFEIKREAEK